MKTGSLRRRVTLTTLALLAIVLVAVVSAVTLAYRAKLNNDLRTRLSQAGAAIEHAGSGAALKELVPGLALEGIAIRGSAAPVRPGAIGHATSPATAGATIQIHGSLLILDEVLPGGTRLSISASRASIDHAVTNLLLVELVVAAAALVFATLLVLQGTRTALRPLSAVIETATRITHGDSKLRLNPSRTDTELGSLAHAFDGMLDALETAVEEARASDAATRRFLADASHELRTPIAALQASVETLLGLARLEARPTRTPVDLAAIARPLVDDAQAGAPDATITLSADDDTTVRGDPDALERVLRNLLDNALGAIGPKGRIEVQLRRINGDGDVQALVTDDGPGVPAHQREQIFERFVRLDPSKPGHGLGLSIARRIAHQHHGDLTCDPTPNGASFTLHLPTEP
jgi:two-component system, OmpR family, sensor kinase